MTKPWEQAAIAGIGQTEFSKNSGRSERRLAGECILSALDDAGLTTDDVDGLITFTIDNNDEIGMIRTLGMPGVRYNVRLSLGGGGSAATIYHAAAAIASGFAKVVVIWRAMNERSEYRFGQPQQHSSIGNSHGMTFMEWGIPFGLQFPAVCEALGAQRYMSRFGVTSEDLGRVSVTLRKHASTNPNASFYQKPITLDDHQNSKWIAEPVLRMLDCCQESDGGVALVITSIERARDLKRKPIHILGTSHSIPFNVEVMSNYYVDDLSLMPEAQLTAHHLYEQTGLKPSDIDVALLYDAFTPQILKQLEAFGFCGLGEGKDFVKDGQIGLDGQTPVNPNGGLIGEAYIHGLNNITEGVRQLRGVAANQLKDPRYALVSSGFAGAILTQG